MEAIDRYILVGLLEGNATSDHAYYRACNVARQEVSRDLFEARITLLRGWGLVGVRPDPSCKYKVYVTHDGRETLYAELRREPAAASTPPYQPERRIQVLLLSGSRDREELKVSTRLSDEEFNDVIEGLISTQTIYLDRDGRYALSDVGLRAFLRQIGAQPPW